MTTSKGTVTVRFLLSLQDVLQEHGVSTPKLAKASGISEKIFNTHTSFVTNDEVGRYVYAVRELTGRTDLGFEMGQRIKVNANGPLGYGLLSSMRMHDYMDQLTRHYHLINAGWSARYRRNYSGGEVVFVPCLPASLQTLHFSMEAIAMALQYQIQQMLQGKVPPYDIHMYMPRPQHIHRYNEVAPARFHFHESAPPSIRFVMGSALLDCPLPMGDLQVMREVDARCTALGSQAPRTEMRWADHVTMMLRDAPAMQLTLEDLAKHIRVSARTIDRHLKSEGVGYRELSDKVRFERACTLLSSDTASVVAVAEQMGFSDAANFSRAFKRVLGVSPSDYQRGDR